MPINVKANLENLTQSEFGTIAYDVMNKAFAVHNELGPLFDEIVYKNALHEYVENAMKEVEISVSFHDFQKSYYIDLLVSNGAIFELKAVEHLNEKHRSQLVNYLLLTGSNHGKLINFRGAKVEHEFVNTKLMNGDRRIFSISDENWYETDGFSYNQKDMLLEIVKDWGVGLDCCLYREALFHLLGGYENIYHRTDVYQKDTPVAQQTLPLCGPSTGVFVTTFQEHSLNFHSGLKRLVAATKLNSIQWINIARNKVTFNTLAS